MNRKKTKEAFNDLLIPILLVLCGMPFIIYLAEYSCGYSKYQWYSQNDIIQDLYCYYRSYFFEVIAIITLIVLIFRMGLYAEKRKHWKIFIPLGLYGIMITLSTIFSINPTASTSGNFYQFQNIFVLLGYLIICFYTYQILDKDKDYVVVWKGIQILFSLLAIVGTFQLFKKDLLNFKWVQKLIMSPQQYSIYAGQIDTVFTGNNVFLTLFNPNYAGIFLVMLICVLGIMFYSEKDRKKRIFTGLLLIFAAVLMWFTYSRATLISLFVGLIVFLMLFRNKIRTISKYLFPGLFILMSILVLADSINDWKYVSRFVDDKKENRIQRMVTKENGIELNYDDKYYRIAIENEIPVVFDSNEQKIPLTKGDGDWIIDSKHPINILVSNSEEKEYILLCIDDLTYTFVYDESNYFFENQNGNLVQLIDIPKIDFKGYEYLGSGRVYIWSRTIPMLKDYMLIGSGPDTFPEAFPQNDYVGKNVYAQSTARIIEKPHNDYLLQWIQNGFIGFVGMFIFYILFIIKCGKYYCGITLDNIKNRLGAGCFIACICYMVSSLFNDSTLFTTPTFWVFAGIALAASANAKES